MRYYPTEKIFEFPEALCAIWEFKLKKTSVRTFETVYSLRHQCHWFPSRDLQVYWLLHGHPHSLPLVFLVHLLWFYLGCLLGRSIPPKVCKRSSLAKPPWAFF